LEWENIAPYRSILTTKFTENIKGFCEVAEESCSLMQMIPRRASSV